jgi:hypothetical protein
MKRTHLIAVTVGLAASMMLAQDAFARARMYNPNMGRFMQRDPLGIRLAPALAASVQATAERNLSPSQFTQRDPKAGRQYADGMNEYQYVRSNPVTRLDPSGLVSFPVYGYYCGTGNKWPGTTPPPPKDASDKACQDHDACYAALGLSGINDRSKNCGQRDCDRKLYNAMLAIWLEPDKYDIQPGTDGHKIARTIMGTFRVACDEPCDYEKKKCPPTVKCSGRK